MRGSPQKEGVGGEEGARRREEGVKKRGEARERGKKAREGCEEAQGGGEEAQRVARSYKKTHNHSHFYVILTRALMRRCGCARRGRGGARKG